jgi:hypothetical protein
MPRICKGIVYDKAQYEAFEAINPFFGVILKGLQDLLTANTISTRLPRTCSSSRAITFPAGLRRSLDLTDYGRQETWEDSPPSWPQTDNIDTLRSNGRPRPQWSRLKAGHSDDLGSSR